MFTHNEILAGLSLLFVAISCGCGLLAGHWWWPSKQLLTEEMARGYDRAIDHAVAKVERDGLVLRLSPNGIAAWCDAGSRWDQMGAYGPEMVPEPTMHGRLPYAELADEQALAEDWAGRMLYAEADWHLEAAAHEQAIERWMNDGAAGTMPRWVLSEAEALLLGELVPIPLDSPNGNM